MGGAVGRRARGSDGVLGLLGSQAHEDAAAMRQRAAEAELQLAPAHAELQRLSAVADRCGPIGCTGGQNIIATYNVTLQHTTCSMQL